MNSTNEENAARDEVSVNNNSGSNLKSHDEANDKCPRPGKYILRWQESIAFVRCPCV